MTNTTQRPLTEPKEKLPAPGFEIKGDDPNYLVTRDDIERYPELEGVVVIERVTFDRSHLHDGYHVKTYEAIVNLRHWDDGRGTECPFCGSVQARRATGNQPPDLSFESLTCTACGEQFFHSVHL